MTASTDRFSPVDVTDLPDPLKGLVRTFDPTGGALGRGHKIPLDNVLKMKTDLQQSGFQYYTIPGFNDFAGRFIQVYGMDGAPSAIIWFGFTRKHQSQHQVIAFETTLLDLEDFKQRT